MDSVCNLLIPLLLFHPLFVDEATERENFFFPIQNEWKWCKTIIIITVIRDDLLLLHLLTSVFFTSSPSSSSLLLLDYKLVRRERNLLRIVNKTWLSQIPNFDTFQKKGINLIIMMMIQLFMFGVKVFFNEVESREINSFTDHWTAADVGSCFRHHHHHHQCLYQRSLTFHFMFILSWLWTWKSKLGHFLCNLLIDSSLPPLQIKVFNFCYFWFQFFDYKSIIIFRMNLIIIFNHQKIMDIDILLPNTGIYCQESCCPNAYKLNVTLAISHS